MVRDPNTRPNCEPQSARSESAPQGADAAPSLALGCAVCGRANAASRKFCAHCGKSLWESCPKCGEVSPAGERFCGVCGVNLTDFVEDRIRQFEVDLGKVERLSKECRFAEAITILVPISKSDHPRLSEHSARAGRIIGQLHAQRDRKRIIANERFLEAQQLLEANDFRGALAVLASVPVAMWTPEMTELAVQVRGKQETLATMERDLAAAIREKRLADLPTLTERLLAIKPDHAQGLQLARKLESHLVKAAREKLAACQYDDAVKILSRLVEMNDSEETARLKEHARELAWISRDLRTAPEASAGLLALSERLLRVMPQDQDALHAYDEIRKRRAGVAPHLTVPWSAAPAKTPFGCEVRRIAMSLHGCLRDGLDAAPFAENPGDWLCAMGLALQAIGEGPLAIDLLPAESRSLSGKMARFIRGRPMAAWGFDLGSTGLRAVRVARSGSSVVIDGGASVVHRKSLGLAMNAEEEQHILGDSLDALLAQIKIKGDNLAVSLPGRFILTRQFKVPSINPLKLAELVEFEARQQLPIRLEDLVWHFQPVQAIAVNPQGLKCEHSSFGETAVFVAAAKRVQVLDRLQALLPKKLSIDLVQAEGLAMHNALAWLAAKGEFPAYGVDDSSAAVIVADVGGDAMNLLIRAPDAMWLRTVGLGGHSLARALKREFDVSLQVAERIKHDPTLAPSFGRYCDAVEPVFKDIAQELHASFDSFQKAHPGHELRGVLLTGGGSQTHGLLRHLRTGR